MTSLGAEGRALVKYHIGKFVSAPKWLRDQGYHLTAFSSQADALEAAANFDFCEIWLAEAKGKVPLQPFCSLIGLSRGDIVQEKFSHWPKGTIMVTSIKLERRVGFGQMRVYKVVRRCEDGILRSIIAEGKAEVEYELNRWSYPPEWLRESGYMLFAFSELESAVRFSRECGSDAVVLRCTAGGVITDQTLLPDYCDPTLAAQGRLVKGRGWWTSGTVMALCVYPEEVVYPVEEKIW